MSANYKISYEIKKNGTLISTLGPFTISQTVMTGVWITPSAGTPSNYTFDAVLRDGNGVEKGRKSSGVLTVTP